MLSPDLDAMSQAYARGQMALEQLEDWLIPLLPNFACAPENVDADLSALIVQGLAEISDGITTEDELRDSVRAFLIKQPLTFEWIIGGPESHSWHVTSGSSNQNAPVPEPGSPNMTIEYTENLALQLITA